MTLHRKTHTFEEVLKHNKTEDCWVIISGKVYDLTSFIEEHPGGAEVLLAATGKDGTSDYDAAGHSDYAIEMMEKYYIGKIDTTNVPLTRIYTPPEQDQHSAYMTSEYVIKFLQFLFPLLILGLVFAVRYYTKKE
ncbi:putative cytochrome b5-like heme/steroid binding domain-containing protein [Lupinus albus]|uniref:Putative cytochrome b5-like heme/steroid binding domain-containing protein n=1 Tax=Lupinus albus TaxID=3870 RepID=A0A6A4PR79_LUPAL|nr:putative cytochrome b5-like heme/steroid binding domain-containing protein [Lupinus albus]